MKAGGGAAPGATEYIDCLERARGVTAFTCACTPDVWKCLVDVGCRVMGPDQPVDEAGPWCRRYVAHQGLGCSPSLCGERQPVQEAELPNADFLMTFFIAAAVVLVYASYQYHASTPAGQLAFGIKPPPAKFKRQ
eukprot:gene10290-15824_t